MADLEVMMVYHGRHTVSRVDTRLVKMFVIKDVTRTDRSALMGVLDSGSFRNRFYLIDFTHRSRLILYYDDLVLPFWQMFDKLFDAVEGALRTDEPARV